MLGRHHAHVGGAVGAAVTALDGGPRLFARALEAVHPLGFMGAAHGAVPASAHLATLTLPPWFAVPTGFCVAYVVGVFFAAGFALLADIDSHSATLGKVFPDWGRRLAHIEHRGVTHWPATGLAVVGVVWLCSAVSAGGSPASNLFPHLAMGGYLFGHLLMDFITEEGLVLGGPFVMTRVRLPIGPFRLNTGRRPEAVVAYGTSALLLLWSWGLLGPVVALAGRLA